MSSDANDLGIDEFDRALEVQGNEAEARKKLVDFISGDGAEVSSHDGSPGKLVRGNKPSAGVLSTIATGGPFLIMDRGMALAGKMVVSWPAETTVR